MSTVENDIHGSTGIIFVHREFAYFFSASAEFAPTVYEGDGTATAAGSVGYIDPTTSVVSAGAWRCQYDPAGMSCLSVAGLPDFPVPRTEGTVDFELTQYTLKGRAHTHVFQEEPQW